MNLGITFLFKNMFFKSRKKRLDYFWGHSSQNILKENFQIGKCFRRYKSNLYRISFTHLWLSYLHFTYLCSSYILQTTTFNTYKATLFLTNKNIKWTKNFEIYYVVNQTYLSSNIVLNISSTRIHFIVMLNDCRTRK